MDIAHSGDFEQSARDEKFNTHPIERTKFYRVGEWLRTHQSTVYRMQWTVVVIYLLLLVAPNLAPLPDSAARIHTHITLFSQFVFWGIWWPFVLLSMAILGRSWCGLFCPEGMLTEFASRNGRGRSTPQWMTWPGWPFVAFSLTTIYGQLVSVYQYPAPAILLLGGSTIVAMAVGFLYGKEKRVWCRYLCPVSGVFSLLSKLSPLSYRVDQTAWRTAKKSDGTFTRFNCAPLVPVATMKGSSQCHMCGRCSGFRGAIELSTRAPNYEIVRVAGSATKRWESILILYGIMGIALGAFHWTSSSLLISLKQTLAYWLFQQNSIWLLDTSAPWWLLTNYPARNDSLSLLDGALIILYIAAIAVSMGTVLSILIALATRVAGPWSWRRFHHLTQALIPIAGCGLFLGLSALTVTILHTEGVAVWWANDLRAGLLFGSCVWSSYLAYKILCTYALTRTNMFPAMVMMTAICAISSTGWGLLFFSS